MKENEILKDIREGETLSTQEIRKKDGDNDANFDVLHGNDFVHRRSSDPNRAIAKVRGVRGRPGQELSRKQKRKAKLPHRRDE